MKKFMDMIFGMIATAGAVWLLLVVVNAQSILARGEARSLCEAVAVAARMPLV